MRIVEETKRRLDEVVKEELNIRVKTVEMYMRVMSRVGVRVEMLGREISFASRDEDAFLGDKMEWRKKMTVREKRLLIGFYVKLRAAEFVRGVENALAFLEEGLGEVELIEKEGLRFIVVGTGAILQRLWWSWNLRTGVNQEDFE